MNEWMNDKFTVIRPDLEVMKFIEFNIMDEDEDN